MFIYFKNRYAVYTCSAFIFCRLSRKQPLGCLVLRFSRLTWYHLVSSYPCCISLRFSISLSFPTYPFWRQPSFGLYHDVSVVPRYIHLLVSIKIIIVQPFVTLWSLLWLLLTSYGKLYSMIPHVHKTSPGKNDNLPLMSLPHLLSEIRAV